MAPVQVGLFCEEPAPVILAGPLPRRNFYRCVDCLSVVAFDGVLESGRDEYGCSTGRPAAKCGACDGRIEHMGEVVRETLRRVVGYRAVCDSRCTHARGPSCDCACGGAHHGSGLVVPVVEVAGVPRLQVAPGAPRYRGEMWRAIVARYTAAWKAKYGYVTEAKRGGGYLDGTQYALYREGGRVAERGRAARAGRTAARVTVLEGLIAEMQGGAV